jgi:hypothetical protein
MEQHLFEHAKNLYEEDYLFFQQDPAPSHKVKRNQK